MTRISINKSVVVSNTVYKLLLERNAPTTMRCLNKDRGPFRIWLFCGWGVLPILGESAMTVRKVSQQGLGGPFASFFQIRSPIGRFLVLIRGQHGTYHRISEFRRFHKCISLVINITITSY